MSTNKLHANAYEAQLTTEEREQLQALLNQPNLSLADIQAQAPPWHSGPAAGAKPSLMALSRMAARLRAEDFLSDTESHGEALLAISQQLHLRRQLVISIRHLPSTILTSLVIGH